jgi:hypothetical protein
MDAEPFVHGRLDREATKDLLKLLGVRSAPAGPAVILDRLRAFSKAENPPIQEVEKWYGRLDQVLVSCSTDDFAKIKAAFQNEKIVLTQGGLWVSALGIYLSSDEEDVLGTEVVRSSVRELTLWRKVGIADRPSTEHSIQWLKSLPSGRILSQSDIRRVRALLPRHAARIWAECGHWLNLAREWAPTPSLEYCLTLQSLISWEHLHEWVKKKTADLQSCASDVTELPPFSGIPRLAGLIENRFERGPRSGTSSGRRPWLNELGTGLQRINLADEAEMKRVRELAEDLTETVWQTEHVLETIPYINGVPAGTPKRAEVLWRSKVLYAVDRGPAKLARAVSLELGRFFGRLEIADAIKLCFDRPPEFVADYLDENFELVPAQPILQEDTKRPSGAKPSAEPSESTDAPSDVDENAEGSHSEPGSVLEDNGGAKEQSTLDEDGDGEADADGHEDHARSGGHTKTPPKPTILERFANMHGFQKDGDGRFFHPDGSWIGKSADLRFWERWTGKGKLVGHYWLKDHCLERQPLPMASDVWAMIEKFPDQYSLVLCDPQDKPVEISGDELLAMRESGQITIHPASYRLVYSDEKM